MALPKHHKHCTFKKTQVCICLNIQTALKEQAAKHENEVRTLKLGTHKEAVREYRSQIIDAFTDLIDAKFQIASECNCSPYNRYDRYY